MAALTETRKFDEQREEQPTPGRRARCGSSLTAGGQVIALVSRVVRVPLFRCGIPDRALPVGAWDGLWDPIAAHDPSLHPRRPDRVVNQVLGIFGNVSAGHRQYGAQVPSSWASCSPPIPASPTPGAGSGRIPGELQAPGF